MTTWRRKIKSTGAVTWHTEDEVQKNLKINYGMSEDAVTAAMARGRAETEFSIYTRDEETRS